MHGIQAVYDIVRNPQVIALRNRERMVWILCMIGGLYDTGMSRKIADSESTHASQGEVKSLTSQVNAVSCQFKSRQTEGLQVWQPT